MDLKSEPGAFYKYLLPVFLIIGLLILWQILCTLFEIPVCSRAYCYLRQAQASKLAEPQLDSLPD